MKHIAAGIVALCLPFCASATDVIGDNSVLTPTTAAPPADTATMPASAPQPKFFPLADIRSGRPQSKEPVQFRPQQPMRSDSTAMSDGFMRIDRKLAPIAPQHSLLIQAAPPDPTHVIRGTDTPAAAPLDAATAAPSLDPAPASNDPILSLFNGQSTDRPSSFRDALTGHGGANHTAAPLPMHGVQQNWPLPASVSQKMSSGFGFRADPLNQKPSFHGGIDIAAATGTPVLASADGTVTKVGREGMYGNSITVLHSDGVESKYGHLSAMNVTVGQHVRSGQTIGAVGATGRVTGPHLDYRLAQDGVSIDPLTVLLHQQHTTQVASLAPTRLNSPIVITPKPDRLIIVQQ